MTRLRSQRRRWLPLAILWFGAAGCQVLDHDAGPSASKLGGISMGMPTLAQQADAQIAVGRAAEQRGDLAQAEAAYRAALTRDRDRADAMVRLAILADRRGRFAESSDLYRQALEADPGNPETFCDLGYSLYLQQHWDEAEMNLRQAIILRPDLGRAHNNLGLVLAHGPRSVESLAEFHRAGCTPAQAHENLAFALSLEQRFDEAREQYRLALVADPASEVAQARTRELDHLTAQLEARPDAPGRDPALLRTSAIVPARPADQTGGASPNHLPSLR